MIIEDLKEFKFKEVLNSDVARKAIFVLLQHLTSGQMAILICDKHAFDEDSKVMEEWIKEAKLRVLTTNDIYGNYEILLPQKFNEIKTTFIYPADEKHIQKYRKQNCFLIFEAPDDYLKITSSYIKESTPNLKWVYNFLEKKSEADRIILEDPDSTIGFLVAPDLKWNGENIEELYLQVIVNRRDLHSVRDLTDKELPLLENIKNSIENLAKEKYGLKKSQLKLYFHYQPSYYHLHVHVNHISYDAPGLGFTCILLEQVIQNIKMMPNYYQKATLAFVRRENDGLYKLFTEAGRS